MEANTLAMKWALRLARGGLFIFPVQPNSKVPYGGESWTTIMTRDEDIIRGWFEHRKGMNYGVCPGIGHVIIDLDVKETVDGIMSLTELQMDQDPDDWVLGNTFTVETPSGGLHLYLSTDGPASNSHSFPQGIDVRGHHGYVVGPGCTFKGRPYKVTIDTHAIDTPAWVRSHLIKGKEKRDRELAPLGELDTEESWERAMKFLVKRDPAIEGLGGDAHTYVTVQHLIDIGLSREMALQALVEPFLKPGEDDEQSWNERCVPPWDVEGAKGTLEEKVNNAWQYRDKDPGIKGETSNFGELAEGAFHVPDEYDPVGGDPETRFNRILDHLYDGGALFARNKRREYIIPGWLLSHGMHAFLARRGGGKTTVMLDIALHLACDMPWHDTQVKEGLTVIYICGEDDEGAEEQIRAWCIKHEIDEPPKGRFLFLDIITDLMSPDDTREWAEAIRSYIGQHGQAVVFLDTWQRASSRGGQNKDEDMQLCVAHVEALAKSLNGPSVVAFHPPKHDTSTIMGSSVIENATQMIWDMTDQGQGRRVEVTRSKGAGEGNYKLFRFDKVELNEIDQFGRERTGVVPEIIGGSDDGMAVTGDTVASVSRALAVVMRHVETHRKDRNPKSTKPHTISNMAKEISNELTKNEMEGDEKAKEMLDLLRNSGIGSISSWQRMDHKIKGIFGNIGKEHDFGDGIVLKSYKDGAYTRIKLEKGGICS